MKKKSIVREFSIFKVLAFVFVLVCCLIFLACLLWAFLTSFKWDVEFHTFGNILGLPKEGWRFDNWYKTFQEGIAVDVTVKKAEGLFITETRYIETLFLNSILYAVGCTVFSVMCRVVTAYVVAKYTFPGRKVLYTISIVTMILPIVGSMPSMIRVLNDLGLYDTLAGTILMNGGFQGLYFLLFYSAFVGVSDTYLEAARIDGAGHFRVMGQIVMPLVTPTIIAIMVMQFISFWNGYEQPMVYMPNTPTISYGLYRLQQRKGYSETPRQLAGAVMACIPILIVFIIFRNKIMNNMSIGGIKG